MRSFVLLASIALGAACHSSESAPIDPWDALALPPVVDESKTPGTIEIRLRAGEAQKTYPGASSTKVWAYNGTVPGPLIDATVGDELLVHFTNDLPEPTTVHWHGVRVPASMDGTLAMQSPVPPGGTFDYAFTFKDAGLFWFHPHMRSDIQIKKGLYGVIRVRGPNEPTADHEGILVFDDVTVQPDGTIPEYLDDESKMLGRQGSTLLVNGLAMPTIPLRRGAIERLRLLNTANGRFFDLAASGIMWRVVGTDGGLVPVPYDTDHLLIAPGERYDVMIIAQGPPGSEITLVDEPYDRGHGTGSDPALPVATFVITDAPPLEGRALPSTGPSLERLPGGAIDHSLLLDEAIVGGELVFTVNGASYPDVPTIDIPNGAVQRLLVDNRSEMDHPFHLHGFFFQLLARDGVPWPPEALANKDTVIVPAKSALELVARFDSPGRWMYHCHILEHAEGGMMGEIQVP